MCFFKKKKAAKEAAKKEEAKKLEESKKVEEPKKEEPKVEAAKKSEPVKKVEAPKKAEPKKEEKEEEKPAKKEAAHQYHVVKRASDNMWEVKYAGGSKAIKLFKTQAEAIEYTEKMAENQGGSMLVHNSKGANKGRIKKK